MQIMQKMNNMQHQNPMQQMMMQMMGSGSKKSSGMSGGGILDMIMLSHLDKQSQATNSATIKETDEIDKLKAERDAFKALQDPLNFFYRSLEKLHEVNNYNSMSADVRSLNENGVEASNFLEVITTPGARRDEGYDVQVVSAHRPNVFYLCAGNDPTSGIVGFDTLDIKPTSNFDSKDNDLSWSDFGIQLKDKNNTLIIVEGFSQGIDPQRQNVKQMADDLNIRIKNTIAEDTNITVKTVHIQGGAWVIQITDPEGFIDNIYPIKLDDAENSIIDNNVKVVNVNLHHTSVHSPARIIVNGEVRTNKKSNNIPGVFDPEVKFIVHAANTRAHPDGLTEHVFTMQFDEQFDIYCKDNVIDVDNYEEYKFYYYTQFFDNAFKAEKERIVGSQRVDIVQDNDKTRDMFEDFIDRYNNVIDVFEEQMKDNSDLAKNINYTSLLRKVESMVSASTSDSKSIFSLGVEIGKYDMSSDKRNFLRLNIDETELDKVLQDNPNAIKDLFTTSFITSNGDLQIINMPNGARMPRGSKFSLYSTDNVDNSGNKKIYVYYNEDGDDNGNFNKILQDNNDNDIYGIYVPQKIGGIIKFEDNLYLPNVTFFSNHPYNFANEDINIIVDNLKQGLAGRLAGKMLSEFSNINTSSPIKNIKEDIEHKTKAIEVAEKKQVADHSKKEQYMYNWMVMIHRYQMQAQQLQAWMSSVFNTKD